MLQCVWLMSVYQVITNCQMYRRAAHYSPCTLFQNLEKSFDFISNWALANFGAQIFIFKTQFRICKFFNIFTSWFFCQGAMCIQKRPTDVCFFKSLFWNFNFWKSNVNVLQNLCYFWNMIWEDLPDKYIINYKWLLVSTLNMDICQNV